MNETMNCAKRHLSDELVYVRTAEDVWETLIDFMQFMTHTEAHINFGSHTAEINCGTERFFINLTDGGKLTFCHDEVTIEVTSVGGAIFATEPKFTRPLYKSFNVDGECYPKDAYNGILKDAFNVLIDTLFEERIFV